MDTNNKIDTSFYRKLIGEKLRTLRGADSLKKTAKEVGIKTATLEKIEQGKVNVHLLTLHRLCKHYGISPAKLLDGLPDQRSYS